MVRGKRIAMEYSAGDAVPYLDRVPAGVIEMVRAAGAAEIVSSGELVTRFYASWTDAHLASHRRSAETIATIAREAIALAGERARSDASRHRARAGAVDPRPLRPRRPLDRSRAERVRRRELGQPALRGVGRASARDP